MVILLDLDDDSDTLHHDHALTLRDHIDRAHHAAEREDLLSSTLSLANKHTFEQAGSALDSTAGPAPESIVGSTSDNVPEHPIERPNPNINSFSAALSCYPCVLSLPSLICPSQQ